MLTTLVLILIVLWFFGYAPISGISIPNIDLFTLNNHQITLWNLLTLIVVSWAIGLLPRPLQMIASVLLLFWILSTLGILSIAGLPSIIVILIILALVMSLFK